MIEDEAKLWQFVKMVMWLSGLLIGLGIGLTAQEMLFLKMLGWFFIVVGALPFLLSYLKFGEKKDEA
ncbi:MAG: hypothetical protein DRP09_20870 [Candidatus Thorarchaeota archaeon]|nr:MAG: hypothetical protein DRP09_20870 [Candidatus Thorarchaeota archaeon]